MSPMAFPSLRSSLLLPLRSRTLATAAAAAPSSSAVAVFWDLDNKPPNSIPPYDAAVRLHLAASSFGRLRFSVAYANHNAFRHLPAPVRAARASRRAADRREAATPSLVPYRCRVCGRRFFVHAKLVNHFHQIHEREQEKRLRRLESATGGRRVRLVGALSLKMKKYEKAAGELLTPKVGYGLADELRRAGVVVHTVEDRPEAADRALRECMMETMDRGKVGCIMLVSDDSGFLGVMREAKMRCLKTVVVGDERDGALKRCADATLSWKDVVSGKARKEAATTVRKWSDRDLLKKLEWRYQPEEVDEGGENDVFNDAGDEEDLVEKENKKPWWKLD